MLAFFAFHELRLWFIRSASLHSPEIGSAVLAFRAFRNSDRMRFNFFLDNTYRLFLLHLLGKNCGINLLCAVPAFAMHSFFVAFYFWKE